MNDVIAARGTLAIDDSKVLVLNAEQMEAARPIEFTVTVQAERDVFTGVVKIARRISWPGREAGAADHKLASWKWEALVTALHQAAAELEAAMKNHPPQYPHQEKPDG